MHAKSQLFCCEQFESLVSNAGKRGLAVFVAAALGGGRSFMLQARATELGHHVSMVPEDVPVNTVSNMAIFFLPHMRRSVGRVLP